MTFESKFLITKGLPFTSNERKLVIRTPDVKVKVKVKVKKFWNSKTIKQAGAELGQAQYKLKLYFTSIFCIFGFSKFSLVELVRQI